MSYFLRKLPHHSNSAGFLTYGSQRPAPSHRKFRQWPFAVCSPNTVTGSLGSCTRFPIIPPPGRRRALNLYDYSIMATLLYHRSKKSQFPFDKNVPEHERYRNMKDFFPGVSYWTPIKILKKDFNCLKGMEFLWYLFCDFFPYKSQNRQRHMAMLSWLKSRF